MPLVLHASLIGKAKTSSELGHLQVTLRIGNQNLYLTLTPEQASMFPDLVQTQPHPTERKQTQVVYSSGGSYSVTIAEVVPEPVETNSELGQAMVNAQIAVAEHHNSLLVPTTTRTQEASEAQVAQDAQEV